MIDIFSDIRKWAEQNKPFALATVIHTWGSAPRLVGAAMAVSQEMEMVGSVSGGCVEGFVAQKALEVLGSGRPQKLEFGVSDESAWAVGLSCGGELTVFVEKFPAFSPEKNELTAWKNLENALTNNLGGTLLSKMSGETSTHTFVHPDGSFSGNAIPENLSQKALYAWKTRQNQILSEGENQYFALTIPRKSRLIIIGAAHITADLVGLARQFDFETIVIDPRGFFASNTQFSLPPDQMINQWPAEVLEKFSLDAYTYAVILSHDPKIDDQALHLLLRSEVAYIGVLGNKRNHEKRRNRLFAAGFSEEQVNRLHGPVGLDIGAKLPKEIALSILAEIIAVKNGK
ncbi:MAG: XdhC family protein [Bacteroidia bacterium]|nr:XdhC family protein [Bacteroidia bacterium]